MPPKTCFPAADAPRYLRPTYSCFLLIAHRRHLDANELGDPGVLVVCSDWFLWQELCDQGRHAVFAMSGGQGHTPSGPDPDIYNDINDWIYLNADDATRFRGVSLGRKSVFPLAMLLAEHAKLTASLEALSHRYRPDRYIYRDYRADRRISPTAQIAPMIAKIDDGKRKNTCTNYEMSDRIGVKCQRAKHNNKPGVPGVLVSVGEVGADEAGVKRHPRRAVVRRTRQVKPHRQCGNDKWRQPP